MTIAYIIEKLSARGGMERILCDKMNHLADHGGHDVVAVLLWHDELPVAYKLSSRVRVVRIDAPFGHPLAGFAIVWWRFRRLIRHINPDITVYTWVAGAFLASYSGWHGTSVFENHHTLSDMSHRRLVQRAAQRVDCVVCLSDNDAEAFRHLARRTEVISNFTTLTGTTADMTSHRCLAIGRLVPVKDFPRMLRLWKEAAETHPGWMLDIVGDGPEHQQLARIINDDNLQQCVTLHPATDDVARYYANASICLMTSRHEGMPLVLIEAQTCGMPAVAFDCTYGPREIIADAETGFIVPYDDDHMFVSRLSQLMDDDALRCRMGEAARQSAQRFSQQHIMNQWLQLFDSLLK